MSVFVFQETCATITGVIDDRFFAFINKFEFHKTSRFDPTLGFKWIISLIKPSDKIALIISEIQRCLDICWIAINDYCTKGTFDSPERIHFHI
jgi:hypothetical protein